MPVYEYECSQCALRFEVRRGFHESGGGTCPRCGGEGRRIFSAPPLIFKGSGFYVTDHRPQGDHAAGGQPAKPDAAKPAAQPEASKPAAKPPSTQ